jgi:hypothetical protein
MTDYVNPNADLLPDYPPEPPEWTVVASTGGGVRTFHTRTAADWVDLSGLRRDWHEVCDLDERRSPEIRSVPVNNAPGSTSDGFHTFDELYEFRMLYHAAFVNVLEASRTIGVGGGATVKSLKHSDGEFCFGGGWFIVVTELPHGQISNHYESKHWDLFRVPAVDIPPTFDDHTNEDVIERLRMFAEFWKAYR